MPHLNQQRRRAIRAALKIHEHLHGAARPSIVELPHFLWNRVSQVHARLQHVHSRQWQAASQSLIDDLYFQAGHLIRELESFKASLPPRPAYQMLATPADIVADLVALQADFDDLQIDPAEHTISVLTEPIVLEGIRLGRFRIELHWNRIGQAKAYQVIAQEPHCAFGRDDVTHPHVAGGRLCEGDGATPLRSALSSGRLLDFFMLVRQILETYNGASPHVALEEWDGISCTDCGTSQSRDAGGNCDRCDEPLCSDCSCLCERCDNYLCTNCSAECAECGRRYCLPCLCRPAGASRLLCKTCLEKGDDSDDSDDEALAEVPAALPLTAATADGLCDGEIAVPA